MVSCFYDNSQSTHWTVEERHKNWIKKLNIPTFELSYKSWCIPKLTLNQFTAGPNTLRQQEEIVCALLPVTQTTVATTKLNKNKNETLFFKQEMMTTCMLSNTNSCIYK